MPKFIDRTGQRFGRWLVLSRSQDYRAGNPQWLCRCDCGNEGVVRASILKSGESRSCGCYNIEVRRRACLDRATHKHAGRKKLSRTYRIWAGLRHRRQYKTRPVVCEQWFLFENFLADMGECPSDLHTIDRIDNARGYFPANCRWATMKEQQNNRTNNRLLTLDGETATLAEWSRRSGVSSTLIVKRIEWLGWPLEQALTLKPSYRRRSARPAS